VMLCHAVFMLPFFVRGDKGKSVSCIGKCCSAFNCSPNWEHADADFCWL